MRFVLARFALLMSVISLLLVPFASVATASAAATPCAPDDPKPTKTETRLGTISIDNDVIAVGQLMTILVHNGGDASQVTIDTPAGTELTDSFPKTVDGATVANGKWTAGTSQVPAGDYSITVKPTQWTAGAWKPVAYSITNGQGLGSGNDYFFSYYDKPVFTMAVDDRNQVAQPTKAVVRKVTVASPAGIRVNLIADTGFVGTTISAKSGNQATVVADSGSKATFFLFADEGDTVKLTASSPDTCSDSTVTQSFKIGVSDVARTYKGTSLLDYWWMLLILLVIIVLVVLFFMRKKKPTAPLPVAPTPPPVASQPPAANPTPTPVVPAAPAAPVQPPAQPAAPAAPVQPPQDPGQPA